MLTIYLELVEDYILKATCTSYHFKPLQAISTAGLLNLDVWKYNKVNLLYITIRCLSHIDYLVMLISMLILKTL